MGRGFKATSPYSMLENEGQELHSAVSCLYSKVLFTGSRLPHGSHRPRQDAMALPTSSSWQRSFCSGQQAREGMAGG